MPKGDKATLKQKEFAKVYVDTKNATEAAMQVYECKDRHVAQAVGAECLAKPIVKREIEAIQAEFCDSVRAEIMRQDAIGRMLDSGLKDSEHSDPSVRENARKWFTEFVKLLAAHQVTNIDNRRVTFKTPNRS